MADNANYANSAGSVAWSNVTGKPSIPVSPNAYLTQTWHSGSSWYRKYSDGFIIQGGFANGSAGQTYSFPIPFSNNQWTMGVVAELDAANSSALVMKISQMTNSSFYGTKCYGSAYANFNARYVAFGY